jgi:glycosyltransferase involved in cell wall biosynthesis
MNVLLTCDRFFGDSPGGGERIAWDLARLARDQGHDVALLCGSADRDPGPGPADVDGVRVVRYRFPRSHALDPRRFSRLVGAADDAARQYLSDRRWDVVHTHMIAAGIAALRRFGQGARTVATVHSPAVLEARITWADGTFAGAVKRLLGEPLLRAWERDLLAGAGRLHALSRYTIGEMAGFHGSATGARFACIPWWTAADEGPSRQEARRDLGWPSEVPVLYTLRRLVRRMGVDVLVDAAGLLARRGVDFVLRIGGDGPERTALQARAQAGPAAGRIAFLGRLPDADVSRALRASDLFILPTRQLECFGIPALDALAAGCPVVATRVGAIPEMLAPIAAGALVEPGDAGALADRLQAVLDGTVRLPAPAALRAYALARYGRPRVAHRYLALWGAAAPAADGNPEPDDVEGWTAWASTRGGGP